MYIRFVTYEIHAKSSQKLGVFHAVRYLRDDDELSDEEFRAADSIMNWFAENLDTPIDQLSKSRLAKSSYFISWFKDTARDHIQKARDLSYLLEQKNIMVHRLTTKNPGKVVYEDEFQVFAKPYQKF